MITSKKYFNPDGCEILNERIFASTQNNTGFVDFNRSKYQWDSDVYDLMNANTWFN